MVLTAYYNALTYLESHSARTLLLTCDLSCSVRDDFVGLHREKYPVKVSSSCLIVMSEVECVAL